MKPNQIKTKRIYMPLKSIRESINKYKKKNQCQSQYPTKFLKPYRFDISALSPLRLLFVASLIIHRISLIIILLINLYPFLKLFNIIH